MDGVPLIDKPYTRMLAEIREGKRTHDQSTFGGDDLAKHSVCGTPMCTAGSLVQMAGESGYALMKKYGWAGAAALIHARAHPDSPCQNFGSIPQAWAMAYIEMMAEKEASQ
jgi:hypothetical protein